MLRSPNSIASSVLVRWLPLIAFCAVVAHHFWLVNSHAINIPRQDSIIDFLAFVNLTETAGTTQEAIKEWYRQYNDHRTSVSRLVVYIAYLAEGEVNFHTLAILANLALPIILLLFYFSVREQEYRWIWLLASALLLLHLRTHSLVLFSQGAFAFYYVFVYAFASFFVLHNATPAKIILAAFLCTLSAWTLSAGQIAWLFGLASLLHQSLVLRRIPLSYSVVWLAITIVMLMAWQIGYVTPVPPDMKIPFPDELINASIIEILQRYALFFLASLGSAFFLSGATWAAAIGLLMLLLLAFLSLRFYKHEDIRLVLCCWFIVASAAAVTVGRSYFLAPEYSLLSRYTFLSVLLLSALALLMQARLAIFKTYAAYLVVVLAGGYWYWAQTEFKQSLQDELELRYSAFNTGNYPMFSKWPRETRAVVNEAIEAGIYNLPCKPQPACENVDNSKE